MHTLALDIGGANLKAADGRGNVASRPFELWKGPDRLADELSRLIADLPDSDCLAVTMTAELCDCYATRREGVLDVLDAVHQAAKGRAVRVWQTDGRFVTLAEAREDPLPTAAANWRALAQFACRFAPGENALLIDVGSTTTDLIPLAQGAPTPAGTTDTQRLIAGELVYSGVRRTPLCALVSSVPWRGKSCGSAAEWFATTYDVYLTLGELPEKSYDHSTADGRPATREAARDRLARVICADREVFSHDDATDLAQFVQVTQESQITSALMRVLNRLAAPVTAVVISGEGEFLARRVAERLPGPPKIVSLAEEYSPALSRAACAFALAVLAAEQAGGRA